jgi:flagellar hook protein FlgE
MSLFSALTVAVGGLSAQSRAIGNISDNLANTQTTGYKRVDTRFESLVTQSNLSVNDPGGVRATPSYQNSIQGNLIQSQTSTSLAITGAGFFSVRQGTVSANGTTTIGTDASFTRRGDFTLDSKGYMVNGAGYYLTGYTVSSTGNVSAETSPILISNLIDTPVATTAASYSANLPSSAITGTTTAASTIQIYDALGNPKDMSFTWTKTATNAWTAVVNVAGGQGSASSNYIATIPFVFNNVSDVGTIDSMTAGSNYSVQPATAPDYDATVEMNLSFVGAGSQTLRIDFGRYDSAEGVTQYADTALTVSSFGQNGIPQGSFKDLQIDRDGFVILNYDNGRSRTFYQIPIVQFNAPNNLQRAVGGAFEETLESGDARTNAPGRSGAGFIVGNALEGSNVDIADEFTKLIQSQRIYSANARTITTTNSMLEEVINIVR